MKIVERQVGDVVILDPHGKILIGEGDDALREAVTKLADSGKTKIMISRRDFLKLTGAGVLSLYAATRGKYALRAQAAIPGGTLNPLVVPKFQTPMLIPPVMPRAATLTRPGGKPVDYYEISMKQITQQILPAGLPATTLWGYGAMTSASKKGLLIHNAPSLTIEAQANRPVRIKWINELKDPQTGNYLPHLLPVDPTLHWANPPGGMMGRDTRAALPAAAAIGGLAVVIGDATKAAIEEAKAQALLAQAITNNTLAGEANVKVAEAFIEKTMMQAAVADDELRPALASLVQVTGEMTSAQDGLTLALDIAAATGVDLGTATDAIAKAYGGNTKALGTLLPSVRSLIKEGASLDQVFAAVAGTVGGSAAVAANSA